MHYVETKSELHERHFPTGTGNQPRGTQWVANFLVTMTFPLLLAGIGLGGAYSLYAIFAVVSAFYAWKFVRETMGRSLEQMEL